jgi:hypothetical protein
MTSGDVDDSDVLNKYKLTFESGEKGGSLHFASITL